MTVEHIDEDNMIYYDYFPILPAPKKCPGCVTIKDMHAAMFLKSE